MNDFRSSKRSAEEDPGDRSSPEQSSELQQHLSTSNSSRIPEVNPAEEGVKRRRLRCKTKRARESDELDNEEQQAHKFQQLEGEEDEAIEELSNSIDSFALSVDKKVRVGGRSAGGRAGTSVES